MPTINLSPPEIIAIQRLFRQHDVDVPAIDEIPSVDEYVRDKEQSDMDPSLAAEDYPHEFAEELALVKLGRACPVCGNGGCDRGVSWVGANAIHADEHPEARAERAMENRRGW